MFYSDWKNFLIEFQIFIYFFLKTSNIYFPLKDWPFYLVLFYDSFFVGGGWGRQFNDLLKSSYFLYFNFFFTKSIGFIWLHWDGYDSCGENNGELANFYLCHRFFLLHFSHFNLISLAIYGSCLMYLFHRPNLWHIYCIVKMVTTNHWHRTHFSLC